MSGVVLETTGGADLGLDIAMWLIQIKILNEVRDAMAAQQIKQLPARDAQEFCRATR
jgi:hypothetical protein